MVKISEITNLEIIEVEEFLRCENENITISCHLNPEGNAFILAKSEDTSLLTKIEEILQL